MKFSEALKLMEEGNECTCIKQRFKIEGDLLVWDRTGWRPWIGYISAIVCADWQLYEKPTFGFEEAMKKVMAGTKMIRVDLAMDPTFAVTADLTHLLRDGAPLRLYRAHIERKWVEL